MSNIVSPSGTLGLVEEECWDLLTASTVGRIGSRSDGIQSVRTNRREMSEQA